MVVGAGDGTGDETLVAVLDRLAADGFGGQLVAADGGVVRCVVCSALHPASSISADAATRLEGASDPDDMVLVVPARCAGCGTGAVLVLAFGPEAAAADLEVARQLSREATPDIPGLSR